MAHRRAQAFYSKCIPEPNSGCWLWLAACDEKGYGDFWDGAAVIGAHRFSYTIHCGPIPAGAHVLHKCDMPACVNPDHLFLGNQAINMADMRAKGRAATGERHGHCRISQEIVDLIRTSPDRARDLAARLEISESHISQIRSRQRRA